MLRGTDKVKLIHLLKMLGKEEELEQGRPPSEVNGWVPIAFQYVSGFGMAIISGGRLFQALMLLGRDANLYASVLARRLVYDSVCRVRKARYIWWKCISVNVMNGLHCKCQSVNQASFLEREPTKVFLHGCHTLVSVVPF